MKILIYIGFLSIPFHVLATSRLANHTFVYGCDKMQSGTIRKYETEVPEIERIDYDVDYNPPLIRYGNDVANDPRNSSRINFYELHLDNEIKCIYKIDYKMSMPSTLEKASVRGKFFSHICIDLKNEISFISRSDLDVSYDFGPTAVDADGGKKKVVQKQRTELGYLWQKGECTPNSLNYFQEVKDVTQKIRLYENKFTLLKEDKDYNLFYANPGLVIKTKNPKSCKNDDQCDLKIVYKKQLKASIYDADGKLHTDDDLEDRSDCSLEFLSAKEVSIANRFKYFMCEIGL
jgi:hypothetical protein